METCELYRNYIGGRWVDGPPFDNRNPADNADLVGRLVRGGEEDVAAAASAAEKALPGWAGLPAPQRGAFLFKIADLLEGNAEGLAREMTREEGKTLPEARGEVRRSVSIFRYFGGEGSRLSGHLAPSERDRVHAFSMRRPLGVVGLITPWNFPSAIPAWKLAPALVCGNTVVLKPASAAPLSAWRIVEACREAGLPEGVVNFVAGSGAQLGRALLEAPPLKAVSFTGSCETGHRLHADASRRRLRVQLEMGGKNPTIVLADCDLDAAVENVVNGAFASTGQKCTATSRAIVEEPVYGRFLEALVERTRKLKVGNGLEPGVDIGPAIDQAQLDTDLKYIAIGAAEAGPPVFGGRRLTGGGYDAGFFVEPTIFAAVTPDMRIAREEVFGPVLGVMRARDFEDALRIANCVPFGLSASIQTRDVSRVFEFIHRAEAGVLMANLPSAGIEYQFPFGGVKDSSFGPKEQGPAALEFYSDFRTVYLKY